MKSRSTRAFSLIELLVVVTIIAILAGLILPLIQRAQVEAQKRVCMNKMGKIIHSAVMTYAASWGGRTSADPDNYIKEHGYKKSDESGYNATEAAAVDDFVCPLDGAPVLNRHGYPTSYNVQGTYVDVHLGALRDDASDLVMVIENARRHVDTRGETFERYYCFGDGRVELGWTRSPLRGALSKWYNTSSGADWTAIRNGTYQTAPDYETVWAKSLTEGDKSNPALGFDFLPRTGKTGNWGLARGSAVDAITVEFTGLIQFPGGGTWHILELNDDWAYFAVDLDEDEAFGSGEAGENRACCNQHFLVTYANVDPAKHYAFKAMFREGFGGNYFNFYWTQNPAAPTTPAAVNRDLIQGDFLSHIPE